MEKEFVPYEEALALKELGFDEPCFAIYVDKQLQINATYQNHLEFKGWVAAPTFSQAFRWFREKHSLHSNVKCINTTYNNHFRFEIESNSETLYCRNLFDTHEEAELACLRKLIEIVKQGGNNES